MLLFNQHLAIGHTDFGDRSIISNEIQDGRNMLVADYKRDDFPDIFVLSESDSLLLLFENMGLGYFKKKTILGKLYPPARDIVAADFNNDTWMDIPIWQAYRLALYLPGQKTPGKPESVILLQSLHQRISGTCPQHNLYRCC